MERAEAGPTLERKSARSERGPLHRGLNSQRTWSPSKNKAQPQEDPGGRALLLR